MRSWQIIAASAVVAAIVASLHFLPGGAPPTRAALTALAVEHWPAITVVGLEVYGVAAVALSTLAAVVEIGRARKRIAGAVAEGDGPAVTPGSLRHPWARRYLVRLAVTQYFTAAVALLALGLSPIPIETAGLPSAPYPLAGSPALAACGAVVLAGLLGALCLAAQIAARARAVARPAAESAELRLLRQVVDLLHAQTPAPATPVADIAELGTLVGQGQQSVLEAISGLATAVNRLSRGLRQTLEDIKVALRKGEAARSTDAATDPPAAIEGAATELRAAVVALDALIAKLGEAALSLSASEAPSGLHRDAPMARGALAQASIELQELLREIGDTPAGAQDGRPA